LREGKVFDAGDEPVDRPVPVGGLADGEFRNVHSIIVDGNGRPGSLRQKVLKALEIKTLPAAGVEDVESAFTRGPGKMARNGFVDAVGNPIVQPQAQKPPPAQDHFLIVTGFLGIFLVSKQNIDVPFAGGVEGVVIGALVAIGGVKQGVPADGALQDDGHGITSFISEKKNRP